jgi:hypothetical protein
MHACSTLQPMMAMLDKYFFGGAWKRGISKCAGCDRNYFRLASRFPVNVRTALRAEMEHYRIAAIRLTRKSLLRSTDIYPCSRKECADAISAACPSLAGQAVALCDQCRLTRAFDRKLTARTRRSSHDDPTPGYDHSPVIVLRNTVRHMLGLVLADVAPRTHW